LGLKAKTTDKLGFLYEKSHKSVTIQGFSAIKRKKIWLENQIYS